MGPSWRLMPAFLSSGQNAGNAYGPAGGNPGCENLTTRFPPDTAVHSRTAATGHCGGQNRCACSADVRLQMLAGRTAGSLVLLFTRCPMTGSIHFLVRLLRSPLINLRLFFWRSNRPALGL